MWTARDSERARMPHARRRAQQAREREHESEHAPSRELTTRMAPFRNDRGLVDFLGWAKTDAPPLSRLLGARPSR